MWIIDWTTGVCIDEMLLRRACIPLVIDWENHSFAQAEHLVNSFGKKRLDKRCIIESMP
jgi:hypothetical protein